MRGAPCGAGRGALYHACAHNRLHEKSAALLRELDKSVFFLLRAVHFCRTGRFIARRDELMTQLSEEERALLAEGAQPVAETALGARSDRLLAWAAALLRAYA